MVESAKDPETGQFKQGFSGNPNGRPVGARNKLGEAFIEDLYKDWQKHGVATIATVRAEKPDAYLKVIASLLPKDINLNVSPFEESTDAELIQRLRDLDSIIRPFLGPEGGGDDNSGTQPQTAH